MLRPNPEQLKQIQMIARQFPGFADFLNAWRMEELETLAGSTGNNTDVMRGRIQTLTELRQVLLTGR
jgi:hypothetical protein